MKTFLIAGGTKGIGLATAQLLLDKGHKVIVLARNEPVSNPGFTFLQWDATHDPFPELPVDSLDGMMYSPGSISLKPFHRISEGEFLETMEINAMGAVKCLQAVYPLLKKNGASSVVLFSTVAVGTGMPFHASIAMAKGAIEGLTRSLAAEWASVIRVNCIAPSLTQTTLAEKLLSSEEKIESGNKRHPLGRIGQPIDLAHMASFLLLETASWITGQVISVDGGLGTLKS